MTSLDQVLSRRWADFTPRHPERAPWVQSEVDRIELASTGNVAAVPLVVADRVTLHGLDRPSWHQDSLEPGDWTRAGWTRA